MHEPPLLLQSCVHPPPEQVRVHSESPEQRWEQSAPEQEKLHVASSSQDCSHLPPEQVLPQSESSEHCTSQLPSEHRSAQLSSPAQAVPTAPVMGSGSEQAAHSTTHDAAR